ncbi:MAG: heme lyase CcmF/NrfE family subunit [Chloroflexota bacterium]
MADIGAIAIIGALLLAIYSSAVALVGRSLNHGDLVVSARHGVLAVCALMCVAAVSLLVAFITHDFSIRYVAEHSSRDMPIELVAAAFYSGQAGSLLYWAWTLSIFSAIVAWRHRRTHPRYMPVTMSVLMFIQAFFGILLGFVASPFERMATVPADGLGLNPLLYDTGMLFHPPMLLAGYMSWTIPFAFAIAALAAGDTSAEWIRATRRYALIAWGILGVGNLLGGWWAYHVLGWGGYWGWDPVENAAIMPWITGTAYLHSIMIQERRGMLKVWNLVLILLTFFLALFGTFVVRSGIIASVHSFAQSAIGPYYLVFLILLLAGSLGLLFWRIPKLQSEHEIESIWSREAFFLLNNLLFLSITFAIFWGTIFPLVSEAVQGVKLTVGPPFFQQVTGPMLLGLMALMAIGPLLPWRKSTPAALARVIAWPAAAAAAGTLSAVLLFQVHQPSAVIGVLTLTFALATIVFEFARGTWARRSATGEAAPRALLSLVQRNRRRYGGYLVHLGIVFIGFGVIGSNFFQQERQVALRPDQPVEIGRYMLVFRGLGERAEHGARVVTAHLDVFERGSFVESIEANKRFYRNFERQPATGIPIRSTVIDDLYVVLAGWDGSQSASFLIFLNPLMVWIWIGGMVIVLGTFVCLWPDPVLVRQPRERWSPAMAASDA